MDANFVGDAIADNLKCIVCHLVLKDPILLIECGHRLCKECFTTLRDYATQHSTPLLCPHDRLNINVDKVIDDIGVGRMVMDLQVLCNNKSGGCGWSGELRQLEDHIGKQCNVTSMKKFKDMVVKRLDEKDAEMRELQKILSLKDQEIQKLFNKVVVKEKEVEQFKAEKDGRFDSIEERVKAVEGKLLQKEEELALARYEISGLRLSMVREAKCPEDFGAPESKKRKTRSTVDYNTESIGNPQSRLGDADPGAIIKEGSNEITQKITLLEFKVASMNKELLKTKAHVEGIGDIKMKIKRDIAIMTDSFEQSNASGSSDSIKPVLGGRCPDHCANCKDIRSLQEMVMNVDTYIPNECTIFIWKLRNFSYHEKLGKRVDSPKFYSDISGHCCSLGVTWDADKGLNLFFRTHTGLGLPEAQFAKDIDISTRSKTGKSKSGSILKEDDEISALNDFEPGKDSSVYLCFEPFLSHTDVRKFIINDVLTITCKMTD